MVLTPAKVTYVVAGLPAGPRVFGVKATGTGGLDSAISALASTSIILPSGADTVAGYLHATAQAGSHRRRSLSPPQYGKQFTTIRGRELVETWA